MPSGRTERTTPELVTMALAHIATLDDWAPLEPEHADLGDPEAEATWVAAENGREHDYVWVLCRYADGEPFCLVGWTFTDGVVTKGPTKMPATMDQLRHLWEAVT